MLVRIFMREDGGALLVQPVVAVRVVEVPMSVDQMFDRVLAKAVGSVQDARAGRGNAGIDEHLAVGAGQNGDIPARPLDDRDIAAQLVELKGRCRRGVAVARLGVGFRRQQPSAVDGQARGDRAAGAETPSRQEAEECEYIGSPPCNQDR
jgi:hypothetical protein